MQESKQEVIKIIYFVKRAENPSSVSSPLKCDILLSVKIGQLFKEWK